MGYTTDFEGGFEITGDVTPNMVDYINKFSRTRRMKRGNEIIKTLYSYNQLEQMTRPDLEPGPDILGVEGEFFVNDDGNSGQSETDDIINHNLPPASQPGLWCQWVIEGDKEIGYWLVWDGGEKFDDYTEWLKYMVESFFKPWGLTLNGTVQWFGEDRDDIGQIKVVNNVVTTSNGSIVYENEENDIERPCPHCGEELKLKEDGNAPFRNVETYGKTKILATSCCNKGVLLRGKMTFEVLRYDKDFGEDDWGHEFGVEDVNPDELFKFRITSGKYKERNVEGVFTTKTNVRTAYGNYSFVPDTIVLTSKKKPSWMKG